MDQRSPTQSSTSAASAETWSHPSDQPWRRFLLTNRAALGSLAVFLAMLLMFTIANPVVFTNWTLYASVLTTLPVAIFLTVPLVFIVTVGEIDLSFPATMGCAAWAFALVVQAGYDPIIGIAAALVTGAILGWFVGCLVVKGNLSSLIATLGMNFVLRGIILIFTEGKSISLPSLSDSWVFQLFSSELYGVPVQIYWAIAFTIFSMFLYTRHRFGVHIHIVGDNPDSAAQMGINVNRVRIGAFIFVGIGAAIAGVFSTMINFTWWPTSGDGYLLPVLASVFVGGTPTWGGIGTVLGGAIGALTVSFIQTGIVGAGLSGFYVQFFNGLIIILSLLGHRWNQIRYR